MNGVFDHLYELAAKSLAPIVQDPANRERSWDRCYSFFQRYHKLGREQQRANKDLACLHLGFYLASWGMFRPKGKLIYKDYTVYGHVLDLLLGQEYETLWNQNFFDVLFTNTVPVENEHISLIFHLAGNIREYFNGLKIIKNRHSCIEDFHATDTLITKVLLGTLACTPAYDTYFKKGLTACDIHNCGSFTIRSFRNLLNVCRENNLRTILQQQPIEYHGIVYPVMRVIDLYFWAKGLNGNI